MATGGYQSDSEWVDMDEEDGEPEGFTRKYTVPTHNRYEQRQNGGHDDFTMVKRKRKKGSNGSVDGFSGLHNDDKLVRIYEQINKTLDKVQSVESQQRSFQTNLAYVNKQCTDLKDKVNKIDFWCKRQEETLKLLAYKSIDSDARNMRNNIVIYGLTERLQRSDKALVLGFLEQELDMDTSEIRIERAHRLVPMSDTRYRGKYDPKRPMVVKFLDYIDTEEIMTRAYKLRGSNFGIDRQYPKEIRSARTELYQREDVKTAKMNRKKVQIRYPAKLYINDQLIEDKFPDWHKILSSDRVKQVTQSKFNPQQNKEQGYRSRGYSDSTIIDDEENTKSDSESDVFAEETNKTYKQYSTRNQNRHAPRNVNKSREEETRSNKTSKGMENTRNTNNYEKGLPLESNGNIPRRTYPFSVNKNIRNTQRTQTRYAQRQVSYKPRVAYVGRRVQNSKPVDKNNSGTQETVGSQPMNNTREKNGSKNSITIEAEIHQVNN